MSARRDHCIALHDLRPESDLDGAELEQWHNFDHKIDTTHHIDDLTSVACCHRPMRLSVSECGHCMVWRCQLEAHHTQALAPDDIHLILEALDGEIPGALAYAEEPRS